MPKEPSLYGNLPANLKSDSDIVVAAHRGGNFSITDLPLQRSKLLAERNCKIPPFFNFLPDDFQEDPSFVRAIKDVKSSELIESVFECFPFLTQERTIWDTMLNSDVVTDEWYDDDEMLPNLITEYAPGSICSDKVLMFLACGISYEVLPLLSLEFQRDPDILRAAVERLSFAFESIPSHIQTTYPDLAIQAIENFVEYGDEMDEEMQALFTTELWSDFSFTRAWIEAGSLPHARIPHAMQRTHAFGLLVIENLGPAFYFDDLLAPELCSDKVFMTKAVKAHPFSILCVAGHLCRDYDLSVLAYSQEFASDMLAEEDPSRIAFLRTVVKRA